MTTLRITGAALPSLGDQAALTVTHIEGAEALGKPFAYRLLLATPDTLGGDPEAIANVNFKQLVGFEVCVHIELDSAFYKTPQLL